MSIITQEILMYHHIFKRNELTDKEKNEIDQVQNYLQSELPVEKLYLYGSVAHGRPTPKSDYDFLVVLDVDNQTLDAILEKYHNINLDLSRPIHMTPTYLYGFSRRASQPTERESYIHNYGRLLFDSYKSYTVKAKTFTTYAGIKDQYKYMMHCVSFSQANQAVMDTAFVLLLQLYTLKKAHMPIDLQITGLYFICTPVLR